MRLGIPEIITILVVLIAIVISARIFRAGPARKSNDASVETTARQASKKTPRIWRYLRRGGIALVLVGAVFLFAAIGMFRWAFQSYLWSFILVVIGFALVLISRKK
jgi:Na+/H+ antiporter NhaD/arsenite permease-like protein